jgi:hypothetical protein
VNGHYRGIYTLVEKIERHKKKVNISHFDLNSLNNRMPFMVKREGKGFGEDSSPEERFQTDRFHTFHYVYPSKKKWNEWKVENPARYTEAMTYMKNSLNAWEDHLVLLNGNTGEKWDDAQWSLWREKKHELIDERSFISFILMQEIAKNLDGYRRSLYVYKDNGGLLHVGPLWDFDVAYGNLWFYGQEQADGFQVGHGRYLDGNSELFWFKNLLRDQDFKNKFIALYKKLRSTDGELSDPKISALFEDIEKRLPKEAVKRNFQEWNVLGKPPLIPMFVPPPYYKTHTGEVQKMKRWLLTRLKWLDRCIQNI